MNYLLLESLLIDRIRSACPSFKAVHSASALANLDSIASQMPACFVVYEGAKVLDPDKRLADTVPQTMLQTWQVVVAVRNVANLPQGSAQRDEAGDLIGELLPKLIHWNPANGLMPLKLVGEMRAAYQAGVAYFPFRFETQIRIPRA